MNCAAIILAAGFSSRMGADKALLDLAGRSAVEQIVSSYQSAGVHSMVVVTGQNHEQVCRLELQAALVQNSRPEEGMFFSLKAGSVAIASAVDAFFVQPVDTPLVSQQTLLLMIRALQHQPSCDVVIPCCAGRRGHPPLLRRHLIDLIQASDGAGGLRGLLSGLQTLQLPVDDQGVLLGMNTPQEYDTVLRYATGLRR